MFRFSSKSKDKQKSWIIDFVLGKNKQIKGQIVKVCRHISGPDHDGSITKQVCDNAVFITAVFTQEAIDNYSFDEDMCTPPEWNQALLIIKEYSLVFLPAESLENCQFALAIKKFSLLDLNNGIESKNRIYDCMTNPLVQKAAFEVWTEHNENKGSADDSLMLGSQLSVLLDAIGPEAVDSQVGSQLPSTSKGTEVKKQSSKELWTYWEKLKRRLSVTDWIIPKQQEDELASIEEWKEDYVPPPSSSRSDSGDAGSSQLQPIHQPSLPGSSGDQAAVPVEKGDNPDSAKDSPSSRGKSNRRKTKTSTRDNGDDSPLKSFSGSTGDQAAIPVEKNSVPDPAKDSGRRKSSMRKTRDNGDDSPLNSLSRFTGDQAAIHIEKSENSDPARDSPSGRRKSKRRKTSDDGYDSSLRSSPEPSKHVVSGSSSVPGQSSDSRSPGGKKEKKKSENQDVGGSRRDSKKTVSPRKEAKSELPKSTSNVEESSEQAEGSSRTKEKGRGEKAIESSNKPKDSDSGTKPVEEEYEDFIKSLEEETPEIEIVEVFTLSNLPTAWHTSQDSIQLSCPSQPDSQEDSQFENSQASSSKLEDIIDLSQSENSHVANKPDEVIDLSEEPIGNTVQRGENAVVVLTDIQKKDNAGKKNGGLNEASDEDQNSKSNDKQKSSTPSRGQRRRVTSFFNKSIDSSCIARTSTSSRISSVGDEFDSALLPLEDAPLSQPTKDSEQELKSVEADKRRVSFAPTAMSTRRSRRRTEPLDVTESTVYMDAKSHLSDLESPDIDYPQSQPFIPASQDPLAENMEEDGVVQNQDLSKEKMEFDSGKDNHLDISYHHSTQSSAVAPGKPDLSISPIRETIQADDTSMNDKNNSGESYSSKESSGSSVSVVPNTELHDQESRSKIYEKSNESEKESVNVPQAKGKSYLNAYCEQHPSFAESGSDEQIPLSGSIYDFPDSSQEKKRQTFEKIPTVVRRSSRRKSQPVLNKESESEEEPLKCQSQTPEKKEEKQSDYVTEYDSVEIEEYSTSCSDLEERGNCSSAAKEKDSSCELRNDEQSAERMNTEPPSEPKASSVKKSQGNTKDRSREDGQQFYERLDKLTESGKNNETRKGKAKDPEKPKSSDSSELRRRQSKAKEIEKAEDEKWIDNFQSKDTETKDVQQKDFIMRRRQSKAKEDKKIEDDDETQIEDINRHDFSPNNSTRKQNKRTAHGKVQEDNTKNMNSPKQNDTTNKRRSRAKGCEKAQEIQNQHLVTEDISPPNSEDIVVSEEENSGELQEDTSQEKLERIEERELHGIDDAVEDNSFSDLNTQDAELVVLTALGADTKKSSEVIFVTDESERKGKRRGNMLGLKKRPKENTEALVTGKSAKKKKSTSPYFDAGGHKEENNPEQRKKDEEADIFNPDTSLGKKFVTLRRNLGKKQSQKREMTKEDALSVTPLKRKSEQEEIQPSKSRRKIIEPGPSNPKTTSAIDVIEIDDEDEVIAHPKPDILKMMDLTLKRLNSKVDTGKKVKISSAEKKKKEKACSARDRDDHSSSGAMSSETTHETTRIASAEALLTFLNVKPLTNNRILNHRASPSLRNKIYQIYQKPIHYPSEH